jgi:phosphopantothenoylcysteine synthetase/decarboxylase
VGWNADEAGVMLKQAERKLADKSLDYIIANPATGEESSFGSPDTEFHIIKKDPKGGAREVFSGRASKFKAAWTILTTVLGGAER